MQTAELQINLKLINKIKTLGKSTLQLPLTNTMFNVTHRLIDYRFGFGDVTKISFDHINNIDHIDYINRIDVTLSVLAMSLK